MEAKLKLKLGDRDSRLLMEHLAERKPVAMRDKTTFIMRQKKRMMPKRAAR